MSTPLPLEPLTLAFGGSRLIEASAGTGKTYTISGLYLRLLLGHGGQTPLSCEQILVVTFTNAATEELRDRIRRRIQLAFKCFIGLKVNDAFIEQLYQQTPDADKPLALRRLDVALKSLDEAAIFTIHGFCQRILADMAFESSLLFESEFTLDDSEFLHHAVRDFWRESCYGKPQYLAQLIQDKFTEPDTLAKQLRPLLGTTQVKVQPKPEPLAIVTDKLSSSLKRLRDSWPLQSTATLTLLHSLPLNGVRFGKKADNYPKLAKLFDDMENWAKNTNELNFPPQKALEHLALAELKLNKGGSIPTAQEAPLLAHIESLAALIKQFVPAFLYQAQRGISARFAEQKQLKNRLTPDDLLTTLESAISQYPDTLAAQVANRFPVALIDEFQDTDPLQFSIFNRIYQSQAPIAEAHTLQASKTALTLLMIGDPKQAIYAFRGADIYTYIKAREQTQSHYNLDTNYRSSSKMIAGVNALFSQHDDPFISQQIPFEAVNSAGFADKKPLHDKNGDQQGLHIRLLAEEEDKGLNRVTARKQLANDAADEITRLLSDAQQGDSHINQEPIAAKDIAILVRDRNEAAIMKQALNQRQIGAVFLSRDSVFNTPEAKEMALILHALANPKDERAIRAAMATRLLGYNSSQIQDFNQDEEARQAQLELFISLNTLWLQRGIMPALLNLAKATQLIERLLASENGERKLTDFRHLSELLQQKTTELDGTAALVNWYEQALLKSHSTEEGQLRLESEQNLVQIVTIHKSKGLEYPICFVPFVSLARSVKKKPSPMLYHHDNQLIWDINQSDEGWECCQRESLAEDLRLLYVALTRPVHRCYLYIANQSRFTKKSGLSSQLHETAIGYLLGIVDKNCEFTQLEQAAQKLACSAIKVCEMIPSDLMVSFTTSASPSSTLAPKQLQRKFGTPWRVGSYSGLVRHAAHGKVSPGADDEIFNGIEDTVSNTDEAIRSCDEEMDPSELFTRFTFERGANAGSFLHLVFERIDFTQAKIDLALELPIAMQKYGIEDTWQQPLEHWYLDVLQAPLAPTGTAGNTNPSIAPLTLANLAPEMTLVEMEFYFPIKTLNANALNNLLEQYGYSSGLEFDKLQGMLKGFIDLIFEHNGQYFIADYKSNHLGDDFSHYTQAKISQVIASHRYDLQYIIYTLALHRSLKLRLPDYQYEQHIGGSFYLFIRGMSMLHPQSGVFFDRPPQALIEQLDALFTLGRSPEATSLEDSV